MKLLAKMLLCMISIAFALPAFAQRPTITLIPFTGSVIAETENICGFDTIDSPQPGRPNGERLILFGNTGLVVGPLFVQLRNLDTGEIVNLNSSGPARLEFGDTMTVTVHGPSLWNVPPPPLAVTEAAGLPPAPYINGRVTVEIDQNGNVVSMRDFHGTATSVCDLFNN